MLAVSSTCFTGFIKIILILLLSLSANLLLSPFIAANSKCDNSTIIANPVNYLNKLRQLKPGQTLKLIAGTYNTPGDVPGLPFFNLHGKPECPITVTGVSATNRPLIVGRITHNTVRFSNASFITLRNLEIDSRNLGGAGVIAQGIAHDITLENLVIRGVGANQQIVGISTKAPTWNWVIRGNQIYNAGTGMYLGDSDGSDPFVNGLIEHNLVVNSIGYNIQIKHQNKRDLTIGDGSMPKQGKTIIRHNVFHKSANSSVGREARPNLLVGHFPLSGPGINDQYLIYGNFFYQNPSESLFQGEGNVAFYNNVLYNSFGDAIRIQPHNDYPKKVKIFFNTIIAAHLGIYVRGGKTGYQQHVIGNAVFAKHPIHAKKQHKNITANFTRAKHFLMSPKGTPTLGTFDLSPLPGQLKSKPLSSKYLTMINTFPSWNIDFNGCGPRTGKYRGAYIGDRLNAKSWTLRLRIKPASGPCTK